MANEAVLKVRLEPPINYTVDNDTALVKGTICKLTNNRTAIIVSADEDSCAGINASEKIASDGKLRTGIYMRSVFLVYLSGTCAAGDPVAIADASVYPNFVKKAVNLSGGKNIGMFLEDGTNGNQVQILLNVGGSSSYAV